MELLDVVQQRGIRRVTVRADTDHEDIYNISALYEFLETLASLVTLADADVPSLEEKYEEVRMGIVKVMSRFAEIVASLPTSETRIEMLARDCCTDCAVKAPKAF